MTKINLKSELLTEVRRKAAVEALNGRMRRTCEVVVEKGEVVVWGIRSLSAKDKKPNNP